MCDNSCVTCVYLIYHKSSIKSPSEIIPTFLYLWLFGMTLMTFRGGPLEK